MGNLSKAALLGIKHREPVTLKHPTTGEDFVAIVRPLTDGEAEAVRAIQTCGLAFDADARGMARGDMRLKGDLAQLQEQQTRAKRKAVSLALCMDETWSEQEIANSWPPGWVVQVSEVIYRISGISEVAAEARQFREVAGGDATPGVGGPGDTTGAVGT